METKFMLCPRGSVNLDQSPGSPTPMSARVTVEAAWAGQTLKKCEPTTAATAAAPSFNISRRDCPIAISSSLLACFSYSALTKETQLDRSIQDVGGVFTQI